MSKLTLEELADGLALWQEHRPRTAADWIAVALRFMEQDDWIAGSSGSSPEFRKLVWAVYRACVAENERYDAAQAIVDKLGLEAR